MKLICPSYTTLFTPYQTICGELGRPKEALFNLMLLQPIRGGLCRVASRLVLLELPPFLFVSEPLLRDRAASSAKCLDTRVRLTERQLSLALRAESSPRIHRQPPSLLPSRVQELHSQIWPRQSCVVGCLL